MIVIVDGRRATLEQAKPPEPPEPQTCVYFMDVSEMESHRCTLLSQGVLLPDQLSRSGPKFESHHMFDYFSLAVPGADDDAAMWQLHVCMSRRRLVFVCEDSANMEALVAAMESDRALAQSPEQVLRTYVSLLTAPDFVLLSRMEEEISNLEDALMQTGTPDCTKEIMGLRRRLLVRKRYYESLVDILSELEDNQNEWLSQSELRYYHMLTGRADRLFHAVLNLRDYVTQVREAYQAQVDISLNQTMKLFTVITAIFLPLTLIVGWYGMNFAMPEYKFALSYPLVIGLSLAVVGGCVYYFKKNKWF